MVGKRIAAVPEVGRQLVKRRTARIHRSDGARRCAARQYAALGRRHGRARHAGRSRCRRRWRYAGRAFRQRPHSVQTTQPTDGILQFDELKIDPDVVVLATPEIAGLPHYRGAGGDRRPGGGARPPMGCCW